jgi:hypothetical protein
MKIKIFCTWNHFEKICQNLDIPLDWDIETFLDTTLRDLYIVFLKHSNLVIDRVPSKEEMLIKMKNPYIAKFMKHEQANNYKIDSETFNEIDYNEECFFENLSELNPLFFLNKSREDSKRIENQYGYFCFCSENADSYRRIFQYHSFSISESENSIKDWSFMAVLDIPFNSIIFCDDYFFNPKHKELDKYKNQEKLKNVHREYLNNILPNFPMKNKLHITIISNNCLHNSYVNLKKIIEKLRPNLDFSLSIIKQKQHDRFIITNYFLLNSGYGFCLFHNKEVLVENTTISLSTILTPNRQPSPTLYSYSEWIDKVKICAKKFQIVGNGPEVSGEKENRLLSTMLNILRKHAAD